MKAFEGKVAVITGGAGGIGKAIAKALLDENAKVVISDVDQDALDAVREELVQVGDIDVFKSDVSDEASVTRLADAVYDRHNACHLLFNNAGVGSDAVPVWETTPNDWKWVLGVNLIGIVNGIRCFVPRMIEGDEDGVIVNTSSTVGGLAAMSGLSVYGASKAAISIISETLELDLRAAGSKIRSCVFYPVGVLKTGIWDCPKKRPDEFAREKPSGQPEDQWAAFMDGAEKSGIDVKIQDLDELAGSMLEDLRAGRFVSMIGLNNFAELLGERSEAIRSGRAPFTDFSKLM